MNRQGDRPMPESMRAMVLDEFGGRFRLEQRPVPTPGHGEVLVEVLAVGAGVTNELARDGVLGGSVPRVHGHELSGTIVEVGPGVRGWAVGDRVTTSFYLLCQRCQWCTSGVVPEGERWAPQLHQVDGVVDTVATSASLAEGFRALGRAGTLVVLGQVPGSRLSVDPERLLMDELVVAGTRYATRAEITHTMELVRLGKVTPIVGARLPLERLDEALDLAHDAEVFGRIMIDVAG